MPRRESLSSRCRRPPASPPHPCPNILIESSKITAQRLYRFHTANRLAPQEKRFRSMQEHIRRAHPEHYISKLPATEDSFLLMVNTPPSERPPTESSPAPSAQGASLSFFLCPRFFPQRSGPKYMPSKRASQANNPRLPSTPK